MKIPKETLLVILTFILVYSLIFNIQQTVIRVYGVGDSDEYGNCVCWLCVYQWNGSEWNLLLNHTSSSNWTERVVDSKPINITVKWRLNKTLADSESQAVEYTKVSMNITDVWTNKELNNTSSSSDATYYYGVEVASWNQTGKPESGVTYDVQTKYSAYY